MSATLGVVCPANVERPSTGGDPVAITYSTPVPSGGSAPVSVTCQPASGTEFAPGSTPVTCTAQDSGGRQATCSFSITVNVVAQLRVTRFLVFGDSLSEGKVSLLPTFLVDSPSHSYPFKLEAMLKARYTGQDVIVLNEGRGGERASESYGRFQEVLYLHQPDAVLLMHGMNDLIGGRLAEVQDAGGGGCVAPDHTVKGSESWISARVGAVASRSEYSNSTPDGHCTPTSGSSKRMPASVAGS